MQTWSRTHIPTLKESPADAEIASHRLLLRAGLVRKLAGGLYTYMPLGLRVLRKIGNLCRKEMDGAGAIEISMPHVHPAETWKRGPRWDAVREVMYSVGAAGAGQKLPAEPEYVLGPTHEEVVTPLAAHEINSYRDLPKNFYQIQTKFRNEIRPRFGLMRAREFVMKDAYSFDVDDEASVASYQLMREAYNRFFAACGLRTIVVEADTGVMGGSFSNEFMVPAEVGDDDVVFCEESGYAANREKATSGLVPADYKDPAPEGELEEFPTPGVVTIAGLAEPPYDVPAETQFKTLVYVGDGRPFLIVLRGQDELEEAKLGSLGFNLLRPAAADEVRAVLGASPGSLGAVRGTLPSAEASSDGVPPGLGSTALAGVFADHAVRLTGNGVTGANKDGFHIRNVNVARDLAIDRFGDFRRVRPGEPCPHSGRPLKIERAIEVGHIFKLGTKYSERYQAVYTDENKQSRPMVMGCYGIGISRMLQAIIEQSHDDDGIIWPWNAAPYQVLITVLDPGMPAAAHLAAELAEAAEAAGADVLLDDRDERPGVKFKDADLIGIPLRLTVGGRGLKEGIVEMKWRARKEVEKIPLDEAADRVAEAVRMAGVNS